jgi:hypothetical protein
VSISEVTENLIAAGERFKKLGLKLSPEEIDVLQELAEAQRWAGYEEGYKDAHEGKPNYAELWASRTRMH